MNGLVELLKVTQKRAMIVVAATLVGALLAAGLNLIVPVTYVATARVFIATPNWNDSTAIPDQAGMKVETAYGDEFSQMRIGSYERLATSPAVTQPVIDKLQLDMTPTQLASVITCRAVPDTVMLDLQVRDGSADRSAAIANAIADQLAAFIGQLERPAYNAVSPIQPVVIRPATMPQTPSSPRVLWNIASGACIGLLIGITLAFMLEARSRGRAVAATSRSGNWDEGTTLGVLNVGADDSDHRGPLSATDLDEDARFFRLRLSSSMADRNARTLLLTTPRTSTDAWRTAVTLAVALGEIGTTAVVVTADFGLRIDGASGPGLGDVLDGNATLDEVMRRDRSRNLGFVPPGATPGNPSASLSSHGLQNLIAGLRESFDVVIIIGAAVLETAAVVDLAGRADVSVLVLPSLSSDDDAEESERLLSMSPTPFLGRVITVDAAPAVTRAAPDATAST